MVEEKINEATECSIKKINTMKEQLAKLQRSLEDEKSSREQFFEMRAKELKNFESKMLDRFDSESLVTHIIRHGRIWIKRSIAL